MADETFAWFDQHPRIGGALIAVGLGTILLLLRLVTGSLEGHYLAMLGGATIAVALVQPKAIALESQIRQEKSPQSPNDDRARRVVVAVARLAGLVFLVTIGLTAYRPETLGVVGLAIALVAGVITMGAFLFAAVRSNNQ